MKERIYLDDVRTPIDKDWIIARNYDEFVKIVKTYGLENIKTISLDHDLGDTAMKEWHKNVYHNYTLNYDNITEKTGYDCAKWLVEYCMEKNLPIPKFNIQSANPTGKMNIHSFLKNYQKFYDNNNSNN